MKKTTSEFTAPRPSIAITMPTPIVTRTLFPAKNLSPP